MLFLSFLEHTPWACSRHRRPKSLVFGRGKTPDCWGKTSKNCRNKQIENPKKFGFDENQIQNPTIKVSPKLLSMKKNLVLHVLAFFDHI